MTSDVTLSVVIPAWREAARLPFSIPPLRAALERLGLPFEVLLIVAQSDDDTLAVARACTRDCANWTVVDLGPRRGKGHAVRTGIRLAQGEFIFFLDADLSTDPEAIARFVIHFQLNPSHHVLIANRHHPESVLVREQSRFRRFASRSFNRVVQSAFHLPVADTQCGFKAFRREAAHAIFARQSLDGFAFDVEVLLLARALGFAIRDLPVRWTDHSRSTLSLWQDGPRIAGDLLRLFHAMRRGKFRRPPVPPPATSPAGRFERPLSERD